MLTAGKLRDLFIYNPATGVFTRRVARPPRHCAGSVAGTVTSKGYIHIKFEGKLYQTHRLAWLYVTGSWPTNQVDHMDGDGTNNRWSNLREATNSQNQANRKRSSLNTSGFKGVSWYRPTGRWKAKIRKSGRPTHIGYFDSPEEAHAAYVSAAREEFGAFMRAA